MSNDVMQPEPSTRAVPSSETPKPKWGWKIALALAIAITGYIAFRPRGADAKLDASASDLLPVAAVKVVRQDLSRNQSFEAEFRPYQEIEVYAKVSGFVENITVDVGDHVQAGQLIAALEIPELKDDLEHAAAVQRRSDEEVKKADATHEETHLLFTRLTAAEKAQPNLIAQQDIDESQSKDRSAEAGLASAKEQVEVAISDVKKLKTMLAYSQITAPFSGVITKRFTDPGALIHVGTTASSPLVRLSENDRLRLVFPLSVSYVSLVNVGDPVEIQVQSPDRKFSGTVSRFTRKVDTATRTMEVEVDVPNADLKLIPGMYASVSIITEQRKNALVVPIEAVSRQKTATVFLINKDQKIEERAVTLGLETAGELEVVAGLAEGDLVMIGSRTQVHAGQKVSVKMVKINSSENL